MQDDEERQEMLRMIRQARQEVQDCKGRPMDEVFTEILEKIRIEGQNQ